MTKPCPSCGAATIPDARFCRRCGTLLRAVAQDNGSEQISPQAATMPLTDEGRTTDGLAADDPRRVVADTTRVNQLELEAILRTAHRDIETGAQATIPHVAQHTIVDESASPSHDTAELEQGARTPGDYTTKVGATYTEHEIAAAHDADREALDEELTITVPRASQPFSEPSAPLQVQPIPFVGAGVSASPHASGTFPPTVHAQPTAPPPQRSASQERRSKWPVVVAASVAALLVMVAGVLLVSRLRNKPAPVEVSNTAPPAPASDPKKLSEEKMTEAEGLLASGELDGAIARLREAVQLDTTNVKAHRRLADVLLESGARREAIEEFRAVTQYDQNDFTAWRALAFAQLGEGLYAEAAESFGRLLALTGGASSSAADPNDLLAYADALRQSGRTEEARTVYQKLTSVAVAEVANAARQHLSEMAQPQTAPSPEPTRATETAQVQNPSLATPTPAVSVPTPAPQPTPMQTPTPTAPPAQKPATPEEHYVRGLSLLSSNRAAALQEFRAAGNHPDANYYLGLSYVEGRDLRSLKRAEIVAALGYFQIARRGRFSRQAQQYEQRLGREYDRLRN